MNQAKKGRSESTSYLQKLAIVGALEDPKIHELCTGQGTKGMTYVVSGSKTKKEDGYEMVADFVHSSCGGVRWNKTQATARVRAFILQFKNVFRAYRDVSGPKFTLNAADLKRGIRTIAAKLESECPGYFRMEALFGNRENFMPSFLFETEDDWSVLQVQVDDNDEDANNNNVEAEGPVEDERRANLNRNEVPVEAGGPVEVEDQGLPVTNLFQPATVADNLNASTSTGVTSATSTNSTRRTSFTVPGDVQRAAERAVQQNPNGNSVKEGLKGKRDITSAYLSKCEKDSELAEKKFKWEQELHKENMLARQNDLVNKNKQEVMLKCIDKGYSPTTTKRFMSSLFDENDSD